MNDLEITSNETGNPDKLKRCPKGEHRNRKTKKCEPIKPTPAVKEPSPVIKKEPSPVIKKEPSPVIKKETSPVIKKEPSPVIKKEPSPVMKKEPSPVIKQESNRCPKGEHRNNKTKKCEPKQAVAVKEPNLEVKPVIKKEPTLEVQPVIKKEPNLQVKPVIKQEVKKESKEEMVETNIKRCPKGEYRNPKTKQCEPKQNASAIEKNKTQKLSPPKSERIERIERKTRRVVSAELAEAKTKLKPLTLPDIANKTVPKEDLVSVGNFLENLNEKGGEYPDGMFYSGDSFVADVLFMYLLKKYGNKCFYGIKNRIMLEGRFGFVIDLKSFNKDAPIDITGATPLVQTFLSKLNKSPRTKKDIGNYNILYETIIENKRHIDNLLDCIKTTRDPVIIIPLRLEILYSGEPMGHQNMLIYRRDQNEIEHFEPHGGKQQSRSTYDLETILELLIEYISIYGNKKLTFVPSNQVCPTIGPQILETQIKKTVREGGGYCVLWSYLFAETVLLNPTIPSERVMSMMLKLFNNRETNGAQNFTNIIRGYTAILGQEIGLYLKKYVNVNLSIQDISRLNEFSHDKIYMCVITIVIITFDIIFNIDVGLFQFIKMYVWFKDPSLSLETVKANIIKSLDSSVYDSFRTIDREILPRIANILKEKVSDEKIKMNLNSIPESDKQTLSKLDTESPLFVKGYYEKVIFLRLIKEDPEKYTELMKSFKIRLEEEAKAKLEKANAEFAAATAAKAEKAAAKKAAKAAAKAVENPSEVPPKTPRQTKKTNQEVPAAIQPTQELEPTPAKKSRAKKAVSPNKPKTVKRASKAKTSTPAQGVYNGLEFEIF